MRLYDGALSSDEIMGIYESELLDITNSTYDKKSVVIPSGSRSVEAYIFAVDDEVFDEDLENLQDKIAKKYGYKVVRHTHQLFVKPIKKN